MIFPLPRWESNHNLKCFSFVSSFSRSLIAYSSDINTFIMIEVERYLTKSRNEEAKLLYLNIMQSSTSKLFAIELNSKKMETISTCMHTHSSKRRRRKTLKIFRLCELNINQQKTHVQLSICCFFLDFYVCLSIPWGLKFQGWKR